MPDFTGDFGPLITSASFYLTTEAYLNIATHIFGFCLGVAIMVGVFKAAAYISQRL